MSSLSAQPPAMSCASPLAISRAPLLAPAISCAGPIGKGKNLFRGRAQLIRCSLAMSRIKSEVFQCRRSLTCTKQQFSSAFVCAASAAAARCSAEQTQTVTRQSSTITIAPIQGKEKTPELDDGGTGLPPRDDDGDGGGGGGGGPGWTGGFFFFGLLAFLGFLKDEESDRPYGSDNRRR